MLALSYSGTNILPRSFTIHLCEESQRAPVRSSQGHSLKQLIYVVAQECH